MHNLAFDLETEGLAIPEQYTRAGAASTDLHLLGAFRLSYRGVPVQLGARTQRFLALLAIQGRPTSRMAVAETLWPDVPARIAMGNLRTALHRLARRCPGVVVTVAGEIHLHQSVRVDYQVAARTAAPLFDRSRYATIEQLSAALRVDLANDLLSEWHDEEWLRPCQERWKQHRLHALEVLADRLTVAGWHGAAVDRALVAVQADPLRESANEVLIRAYLAEGNHVKADNQFVDYQHMLHTELGVRPSPRLGQLLEQSRSKS